MVNELGQGRSAHGPPSSIDSASRLKRLCARARIREEFSGADAGTWSHLSRSQRTVDPEHGEGDRPMLGRPLVYSLTYVKSGP